MSIFVFIVFIAIGASFLATGLVILAVITASRSTARLAEKYPEIHSEDVVANAQRRTEVLPNHEQEEKPAMAHVAAH